MSEPGPRHASERDKHPPEDLFSRGDAAIRQSELLKRQVQTSIDAAQVAMGKLHKAMGQISRANLAGPRPAPDEDVALPQGPPPPRGSRGADKARVYWRQLNSPRSGLRPKGSTSARRSARQAHTD
jgi:hypothetical protein